MKKSALILGMGKSGKGAYQLLEAKGFTPFGFDQKGEHAALCAKQGFRMVGEVTALDFDLIVLSPGVPPERAAGLRGEVVGEAELAFRFLEPCPLVAITGTNGKTTVTLLTEHILRESGRKAKAVGNNGESLAAWVVEKERAEIGVVELSSYQLETLNAKVFCSAVILNITPDHLDRYPSMKEYAEAKLRLALCLQDGGKLYVSPQVAREYDASQYGVIGKEAPLPEEYETLGQHDRDNAEAAFLLTRDLGVTEEEFLKALKTFKKPKHRIEFVAEIRGKRYYDDSKGTNIDATIKAVSSMPGPVVLIAGGVDKGSSYAPWIEAFQGKVKAVVAIGAAKEKIERELSPNVSVKLVQTLADAVEWATEIASTGDAILLSPGCSSFDMFRDYAHRGEEFQNLVKGKIT